eukprot:353934-Chlamydomonas_euryale.AAC.1
MDTVYAIVCHDMPSTMWYHYGATQARRLEGELDVKLSAFNKLCAGYEAAGREGMHAGAEHLSTTKATEIEALLTRLSDINDDMGSQLGGTHDSRSHLLARHRDILQVTKA